MTALFQSRERANAAVEKLKAYAQPQRLMILSCLLQGERTVSEIDAVTGIGQPALSQQLAELRRADLVKTRRASKQIWYDLADENVSLCVRTMEAILGGSDDTERALENVIKPKAATLHRRPSSGAAGFARIV